MATQEKTSIATEIPSRDVEKDSVPDVVPPVEQGISITSFPKSNTGTLLRIAIVKYFPRSKREFMVWALIHYLTEHLIIPLLWPLLFCHTKTCDRVRGEPVEKLNFLDRIAIMLISYATFAAGKFAWRKWRNSGNG